MVGPKILFLGGLVAAKQETNMPSLLLFDTKNKAPQKSGRIPLVSRKKTWTAQKTVFVGFTKCRSNDTTGPLFCEGSSLDD
jgi:hypothetical protein